MAAAPSGLISDFHPPCLPGASFLVLKLAKKAPTSGPLHQLFFLIGSLFTQIVGTLRDAASSEQQSLTTPHKITPSCFPPALALLYFAVFARPDALSHVSVMVS